MVKDSEAFGADFEAFWAAYPRRIGKFAAQREYLKARRRGVTQMELLNGVEKYIATKPAYADWCHPRTFLSQGRWLDEVKPVTYEWNCSHTPRCPHRAACQIVALRVS
jgi:hypothetical protein